MRADGSIVQAMPPETLSAGAERVRLRLAIAPLPPQGVLFTGPFRLSRSQVVKGVLAP
jgi:hypothetical protein